MYLFCFLASEEKVLVTLKLVKQLSSFFSPSLYPNDWLTEYAPTVGIFFCFFSHRRSSALFSVLTRANRIQTLFIKQWSCCALDLREKKQTNNNKWRRKTHSKTNRNEIRTRRKKRTEFKAQIKPKLKYVCSCLCIYTIFFFSYVKRKIKAENW